MNAHTSASRERALRLREIAVLMERLSDASMLGRKPRKRPKREPERVAVFVEDGVVTVISGGQGGSERRRSRSDRPYAGYGSYDGYGYGYGYGSGYGYESATYSGYGYDGYREGYGYDGYSDIVSAYGYGSYGYDTSGYGGYGYGYSYEEGYGAYGSYISPVDAGYGIYEGYGYRDYSYAGYSYDDKPRRRRKRRSGVQVVQVNPGSAPRVFTGREAAARADRFLR